jgi:ABC-type molybdate transport system substrate-binding protein
VTRRRCARGVLLELLAGAAGFGAAAVQEPGDNPTAIPPAQESAYRFALFVLSPAGQDILEHAGFTAPARTRPAGS